MNDDPTDGLNRGKAVYFNLGGIFAFMGVGVFYPADTIALVSLVLPCFIAISFISLFIMSLLRLVTRW